jgi:hypothetical protein
MVCYWFCQRPWLEMAFGMIAAILCILFQHDWIPVHTREESWLECAECGERKEMT